MLTREQILTADDLPLKEVEVPEWGGSVYVRALTGHELFKKFTPMVKDIVSNVSAIVALCVVDSEGNRIFADEDADALLRKNGKVLDRIASEAVEFNFSAVDEAKND